MLKICSLSLLALALARAEDSNSTAPVDPAVPASAGTTTGELKASDHIFVISSCIHASSAPLSYTDSRSKFSTEERLAQTKQSIDSVKQNIPGAQVVLVEQCELTPAEKSQFAGFADLLMEMSSDPVMRQHTEGPFKGLAESYALMSAIQKVEAVEHKWLFKLSGRYFLDSSFDLAAMTDAETFHMKTWVCPPPCTQAGTGPKSGFHTNLYSVPKTLEATLVSQLQKYQALDWAGVQSKGYDISVEMKIMEGVPHEKMTVVPLLGVSGWSSVSGDERHDMKATAQASLHE